MFQVIDNITTRTKMSIKYAREKDREKREREVEKERERGVKGIERVKGRGIERESEREKIERKRRFLLYLYVKSPEWRN